MARYFAKISADVLKARIEKACEGDDFCNYSDIIPSSDLKVSFDWENVSESGFGSNTKKISGYQTLPNGLTFLGISAGGDWEVPVFFIVYWDGKKLRGYVPTDGNPWNTDTKHAYGNDEELDKENFRKRWPNHNVDDSEPYSNPVIETDKIIADIQKRIMAK